MREILYFDTEQQLNSSSLERFLFENFSCNKFFWIDNFYEFITNNELNGVGTYISIEKSTKGFKFHYSIFDNDTRELPIRSQVELLKVLSKNETIQILSTDDEVNPWSRVLIEPNGQTSTIKTSDEDLVVERFYNFPFGDFRTQVKLTGAELNMLKQIIAPTYLNIKIHYSNNGLVSNGTFNKVKNNFDQLKLFDHHYEILPMGKNQWLDREAKSDLFTELMVAFQKQIDKELCIFPRNFSEIQTIEGGSDSEEHCFILTKDAMQKIIYKYRRNSWLS